jgi:hypothetical protein
MSRTILRWLLILALAGSLALPLSAAATDDFIAPGVFTTGGAGSTPNAVAVADFNGDGNLDVVVADQHEDGISILFGKGNGTFQTPISYGVGQEVITVAVGDFNGDGYPDLAVGTEGILGVWGVSVLTNDGSGTFSPPQAYSVGGADCWGASIAVGDFNNDRKIDLVVATMNCGMAYLQGNGDGTFQTFVQFASELPCPTSVTAGDLNNDGNLDLVVGNYMSCTGKAEPISVLLGQGNGTFTEPANYSAGDSPVAVALADFNGDGNLDIVEINYTSIISPPPTSDTDSVDVFLGNGDGTFSPRSVYSVDLDPTGVVVGDFNGDGNLDLAVSCFSSNDAFVLFGNGKGAFGLGVRYEAGVLPAGIAAGDFTGNGKTDLVTADYGADQVSFLRNVRRGSFWSAPDYQNGAAQPEQIALGEFNRDGGTDVATIDEGLNESQTESNGNYYIVVTLGNGHGQLSKPVITPVGHGLVNAPIGLAVGDFNGDGKLDVAVREPFPGDDTSVGIFFGAGDGTFVAGPSYTIDHGSGSSAILAADLNGDGILDLVASGCEGTCVSVLIGNGNGTFAPAQTYQTGAPGSSWVQSLGVGDFKNNGIQDLVVINSTNSIDGPSVIGILLGNGDGTFQAPITYTDMYFPTSVAVADFNGDGNLDLAITNARADNVGIYLGNGNGTFQPPQTFATAGWPVSVGVGDFNHDGNLDLAVGGGGDPGTQLALLSVLHGNGDGTFGPMTNYPLGVDPAIAVGDLVTNAGPDLAIANENHVTVYLNKADLK